MTRALVLRAVDGPAAVEEVDLNPVGPHQVRVRIAAAGVCHSDLSLANGTLRQPFPVVLGHEGAGVVAEVGAEVTGLSVGDHVVLNWSPPCRSCWFCEAGEPYLCAHADDARGVPFARTAGGEDVYAGLGTGAFATETVIGANACIPVPADIPLAEAALLGCAVLTGVGAILNSARVRPGESVAVIGLGGVGLAALQGARIAGATTIIAVDAAPAKADLALSLGATHFLTPGPSLAKEVRALTAGRGADHAVECVGRSATIRAAWSVTRRGGRATVLGLGASSDQVTFNALEVAYFARTLTGCMYGSTDPAVDVPVLLSHYRAGALDLASLVTDHVSLAEVGDAFDRMRNGVGARTLVHF
ncbi:Zn-dependent alcohol dehydrogenase [Dactylosporangium aurantiacum]|uniref:Zn-dependent alcohol dehydrogenase n=1 Tax=Dactylosporangium aurantiacum TaxID=35754 RepID=A0A9Q9IED3_9ACTN|nr:Zn-dependent alcohol dehydrogenase [Dactylosporangium aurantiacum]MDG6102759.1 Zn-dependent alcohol dehydrogenase [Dactylosporangium aurantiacum]UWZ52998.1 Zn-dependent alcohol dehydrogenase [Dactylosporangium aurantiacum]